MTGAAAVVAGSGLSLAPLLTHVDRVVSFSEFRGLGRAGVPGHAGRFLIGRCGDDPLILQEGRLHVYEGLDVETVARTADVLARLGASTVVFTNAVGGLRPEMRPGDLAAVTALRLWPCVHWPDAPFRIRPDFLVGGCDHTPVYAWMHGPSYETRAEIAVLQRLGAGVVGMSTAPELARCRRLGLRTAVVSCVTNSCCGSSVLTHDEVVRVAGRTSSRLVEVLKRAVAPEAAG